jgi:hypothetical protein
MNKIATTLLGLAILGNVLAQNGATHKPPVMGWASWNEYFVDINDSIIRSQANAMVSTGLADAGYKYINIDDGFFDGRNADGSLKINTVKFPYGMKPLVDYIHSLGLKGGFYSDAGANTCGSQYNNQTGGIGGGMFNHDQQDADLFFKTWGFDFLKVDYCGGLTLKQDEKTRYTAIKNAIDNTGRTDVNLNVCRWQFPGVWVTKVADSWRISTDISFDKYAHWDRILLAIDWNTFLAPYASKGHYNDMDMMQVGRGLTLDEDKSHFAMWCILSSPLVLGNDLGKVSQTTIDIVTNHELIAVNQDTTGLQGKLVSDNGAGLQVWAKPLNGKFSTERAVVMFNRSEQSAVMSVKLKDLNLVGTASVRDLWSHTDLGTVTSEYSVTVPKHGNVALKLVGEQICLQEVFEGEYGWINNFNMTQNSVVVADQGRPSTDAVCSGRAKASWLGNRADNYVEWQDIYAATAGKYTLTLSFISGENRNATFTINGKDTLVTGLNSGGWAKVADRSFPVNLKKGYNTIRVANATGWLPDIDKIRINLNDNVLTSIFMNKTNKKACSLFPNPCTSSFQIKSESPLVDISIYSLTGELVKHGIDTVIPVNDLKQGTYVIVVKTGDDNCYDLMVKR